MNKDNVVALLRKKNMESLKREQREKELHHRLVKLRLKLKKTDNIIDKLRTKAIKRDYQLQNKN